MTEDDNREGSLRLALSQRPDSVSCRATLAALLTATGRHAEAVAVLREGSIFAMGREDRLEELADAMLAVDALPDALEALQAACRFRPGDERLRGRLQVLSQQLKDEKTQTRQLFNQYASGFEDHLARLGYAAPQEIERTLTPFADRFANGLVIDLGCGTGLMGERLVRWSSHLAGVDLSPAMLEEARAKGVYESVAESDVVDYLKSVRAAALIAAADVLVYIGALPSLFAAAAAALSPGGIFVFTVERNDAEGFSLNAARRYAHSETYIRAEATKVGLTVLICEGITPRRDGGRPVDGLLFLLEKPTERP